jgi:hypothetical protein
LKRTLNFENVVFELNGNFNDESSRTLKWQRERERYTEIREKKIERERER